MRKILALCLVLFLSACGGSGGDDDDEEPIAPSSSSSSEVTVCGDFNFDYPSASALVQEAEERGSVEIAGGGDAMEAQLDGGLDQQTPLGPKLSGDGGVVFVACGGTLINDESQDNDTSTVTNPAPQLARLERALGAPVVYLELKR